MIAEVHIVDAKEATRMMNNPILNKGFLPYMSEYFASMKPPINHPWFDKHNIIRDYIYRNYYKKYKLDTNNQQYSLIHKKISFQKTID